VEEGRRESGKEGGGAEGVEEGAPSAAAFAAAPPPSGRSEWWPLPLVWAWLFRRVGVSVGCIAWPLYVGAALAGVRKNEDLRGVCRGGWCGECRGKENVGIRGRGMGEGRWRAHSARLVCRGLGHWRARLRRSSRQWHGSDSGLALPRARSADLAPERARSVAHVGSQVGGAHPNSRIVKGSGRRARPTPALGPGR
jgi:hypothetical protein